MQKIELRGVEVHNLRQVNLNLPHNQLITFCGVSGSGKTSLVLDTLYAEGQRRYIESFSAYTRQFLERLDKPSAERIDGIPPSIAVTHTNPSRSNRSTVGTATETSDYLRLLFSRIGSVFCLQCGRKVDRESPETVAQHLSALPSGTRYMIGFPIQSDNNDNDQLRQSLREDGFVRAVVKDSLVSIDDYQVSWAVRGKEETIFPIVDRLTGGNADTSRIQGSVETAFAKGNRRSAVFVLQQNGSWNQPDIFAKAPTVSIDQRLWLRVGFSANLRCEDCQRDYPLPEPRVFSFNSVLGACPECHGFGHLVDIDMDLVVPDPDKSLRDGVIAPWNTPAYEHELTELLELADDYGIPVDVPFRQLDPQHVELIRSGIPERSFGGLNGFFSWLEQRKYKMHIRVFLSRWRTQRVCTVCEGTRLRADALATRINGKSIADVHSMKISDALVFVRDLSLSPWQRSVARTILDQVVARVNYLNQVGLGYLTLDRTLRTLSGGETQRVALTSALGSSLVNMLYVLDEPSVGLHACDIEKLLTAVRNLKDRGNTVVLIEHEEAMVLAADHVVEIGPAAGESGGRVVFQGTPAEMLASDSSTTGAFLAGKRGVGGVGDRRRPAHGWVRLVGASGNNLRNVDVEFPLGVLCLVTGVSGAGKSTIVDETLYPALCQRKRKDAFKALPYRDIYGDGQIDDIILIDQSPIGRSPRSNPVTYVKAFDNIRSVFAETLDARTHNYTAGHFSFNVDGGRCSACDGDGHIKIDMQFLADVFMRCGQCRGQRYRQEILDVCYRGKNIADVLQMTVRQAFGFFRGQTKVQTKLKRLMDVGLDYLRLGQPANTLSSGEAQRLKLASYLSAAKRQRTLFLIDEPTTGLHFSDILQLIDCFDALLNVGHSLIVVEHNLRLMAHADYIIDVGPGAADEGGRVVAQGTPESVAQVPESKTGRLLAEELSKRLSDQAT